MLQYRLIRLPQATRAGWFGHRLRRDKECFPLAGIIRFDTHDFALRAQSAPIDVSFTHRALITGSIALCGIEGPKMLAVAAVLPKTLVWKVAGESMR